MLFISMDALGPRGSIMVGRPDGCGTSPAGDKRKQDSIDTRIRWVMDRLVHGSTNQTEGVRHVWQAGGGGADLE